MNIQCISSFISTNRLSLVINCQINCKICPNWWMLFYLQQLKSRANTDQNFPTWTVGVTVHNFILILGPVRAGHSSGSGWVGSRKLVQVKVQLWSFRFMFNFRRCANRLLTYSFALRSKVVVEFQPVMGRIRWKSNQLELELASPKCQLIRIRISF